MTGSRVRRVYLFAAVIAAVAAAGTWWRAVADGPTPVIQLSMLVFVAAFAGCELLPIHVEHRRETLTLSLGTVPLIVGLYALGPIPLIVARVLGAIIAMAIRRLPPFKAAVNVAGFWMESVVAITVFAALQTHGSGPATWPAAFARRSRR